MAKAGGGGHPGRGATTTETIESGESQFVSFSRQEQLAVAQGVDRFGCEAAERLFDQPRNISSVAHEALVERNKGFIRGTEDKNEVEVEHPTNRISFG